MMKPVFNERTPKFKTTEEKSFKRNERSQECSTDRMQRSPKGKLSLSRQNQGITQENIYPTEARKANAAQQEGGQDRHEHRAAQSKTPLNQKFSRSRKTIHFVESI